MWLSFPSFQNSTTCNVLIKFSWATPNMIIILLLFYYPLPSFFLSFQMQASPPTKSWKYGDSTNLYLWSALLKGNTTKNKKPFLEKPSLTWPTASRTQIYNSIEKRARKSCSFLKEKKPKGHCYFGVSQGIPFLWQRKRVPWLSPIDIARFI